MKRSKLLAALTALMLILAACSSDDGAADTTEADAGGDDSGGDDGGDSGGDTGGRLDAVRAADVVVCGVNDGLGGFGVVDSAGEYHFCTTGVMTRATVN